MQIFSLKRMMSKHVTRTPSVAPVIVNNMVLHLAQTHVYIFNFFLIALELAELELFVVLPQPLRGLNLRVWWTSITISNN